MSRYLFIRKYSANEAVLGIDCEDGALLTIRLTTTDIESYARFVDQVLRVYPSVPIELVLRSKWAVVRQAMNRVMTMSVGHRVQLLQYTEQLSSEIAIDDPPTVNPGART